MFWVTTAATVPRRTSSATARWPRLGLAPRHMSSASKRRRQVSRRASSEARKSEKSIGAMRVQIPPGLRKSGMPDSVLMPAPVNTTAWRARLLIAAGPPRPAVWAANVWLGPQELAIASISDGAAKLRAIQRNWAVYAPYLHRRATLIQEQLPKVSSKPLVFGTPPPTAPLSSWSLLDARTMLAAAR